MHRNDQVLITSDGACECVCQCVHVYQRVCSTLHTGVIHYTSAIRVTYTQVIHSHSTQQFMKQKSSLNDGCVISQPIRMLSVSLSRALSLSLSSRIIFGLSYKVKVRRGHCQNNMPQTIFTAATATTITPSHHHSAAFLCRVAQRCVSYDKNSKPASNEIAILTPVIRVIVSPVAHLLLAKLFFIAERTHRNRLECAPHTRTHAFARPPVQGTSIYHL